MRWTDRILIVFLVMLLFVEGIWAGRILRLINEVLTACLYESSWGWLRNFFVLFVQKLPVIAQNLSLFVFTFFYSLLSILCLKIYFAWTKKTFFQLLVAVYLLFLLFSVCLLLLATKQERFFKVWDDFSTAFNSPFPLIFAFLILKLIKRK